MAVSCGSLLGYPPARDVPAQLAWAQSWWLQRARPSLLLTPAGLASRAYPARRGRPERPQCRGLKRSQHTTRGRGAHAPPLHCSGCGAPALPLQWSQCPCSTPAATAVGAGRRGPCSAPAAVAGPHHCPCSGSGAPAEPHHWLRCPCSAPAAFSVPLQRLCCGSSAPAVPLQCPCSGRSATAVPLQGPCSAPGVAAVPLQCPFRAPAVPREWPQ